MDLDDRELVETDQVVVTVMEEHCFYKKRNDGIVIFNTTKIKAAIITFFLLALVVLYYVGIGLLSAHYKFSQLTNLVLATAPFLLFGTILVITTVFIWSIWLGKSLIELIVSCREAPEVIYE